MLQSNLPTKKVLAFTLLAMTLVSSSVFANVYKWRDSTGRTQYSDTPPATSYSIVKRSEQINALQSKDVCSVPSAKPKVTAQSKLRNLSANFGFTVLGRSPKPSTTPSLSTINRVSTIGSAAKISATIASITKFVASNAMPAVISPAAASSVVKPVSTPVASPVSIPVATTPAPTTVAINLPPNIVQAALMPAVDISKNVIPAKGYSDLRIEPENMPPVQNGGGSFRIPCTISHMSNDDPIVYPNQSGAAHHHTFFGNTSTNAKSDLMTLSTTGNSTCAGGIANRSSYWMPSMIDTATNTPIQPDSALFYYKSGDLVAPTYSTIRPPPKGLRMIAGNSKATTADASGGSFSCISATVNLPWSRSIPNCAVGETLIYHIDFPQCWDGVNLDSPDHKSHMANRIYLSNTDTKTFCPSTHPIMIPAIAFNIDYKITSVNQAKNWRLASDNYSNTLPGGYSAHADWANGWDEKVMDGIVKNCIQKGADCHAYLLGDGTKLF